MSFQLSSVLSGLAYLALCLLIASFRAWGECLRDGAIQGHDYKASDEESSAGEGDRSSLAPPSPQSSFLSSASCLISLSLFLLMPCGTLPSLLPVSLGASIVVIGLAAALGLGDGWKWIRRQAGVPLCLGVSLAVIARYVRERGVPGELYALDAYVAMPVVGVAEGAGRLGVCLLAAASLLAIWRAMPARRGAVSGRQPLAGGETLLAALAGELWTLAAIAFWVCLFFPASFAFGEAQEVAVLGGSALNALLFWAKVLAVEWLPGRLREKCPLGAPLHALIPVALLGLGAWLLLDAPAG
jgi:hypothetical protein